VPKPSFRIAASSAHTAAWPAWLSAWVGKPVAITWTHNRSTMLSFREVGGEIRLRLHVMFANAAAEDFAAIADYIGGDKATAGRRLDGFIAAHVAAHRRPALVPPGSSAGRVHALQPLFDGLNRAYFHERCTARIVWGRASYRPRSRRSVQLGCYLPEDNLIRMHPCLDQDFVPDYFVRGVVFHEMLHEVFGVVRVGRRRTIHPADFTAVEQSHPDYARCQAWQRQHLLRLLRYRP
jgi:predicted SprT family Zn-dependent metalloprotease